MKTRALGPFTVAEIGLGCMSLSWAYGVPPPPDAAATLLLKALDLGYTHVDTAALYGFGANETLIGGVLKGRRSDIILASKGGMARNAQGQREIDGRPESLRRHCEESLSRLQTEVIDLYYLHRWDKRVPVEDSVGALSELVREGKVKTIGLSEVLRQRSAKRTASTLSPPFNLNTRCGRATPKWRCSRRAASWE